MTYRKRNDNARAQQPKHAAMHACHVQGFRASIHDGETQAEMIAGVRRFEFALLNVKAWIARIATASRRAISVWIWSKSPHWAGERLTELSAREFGSIARPWNGFLFRGTGFAGGCGAPGTHSGPRARS